MTLTRAALLCPLIASLIACGAAGGTAPVGDGGAAQDGAAGAGEAWCGRHPDTTTLTVSCPATWPPTSGTRAPTIGCHVGASLGGVVAVESCIDTGEWNPAQRALLLSCNPSTLPPQSCAPRLVADGGACAVTLVSAAYVRAIALEVVRTGRCW